MNFKTGLFLITSIYLMGCQQDRILVRNNDDKLTLVESRLVALEAKDDLIMSQITALGQRVDDLELFKSFQTTQNSFVNSQLEGLDQRLTSVNTDLVLLASQYATLTQMITDINNNMISQFETLETQIANLQTEVQDIEKVKAIQLCPSDNATYPEQGIVIGSSIYAVYYGVIGGTPQAFLAKLTPGDYVTTNGSNCHFKVKPNGTTGGN